MTNMRKVLFSLIALMLCIGLGTQALAAADPTPERRGLVIGEVKAVAVNALEGKAELSVATHDRQCEGTATVKVSSTTQIVVAGRDRGTLLDLAVGMFVHAEGQMGANCTLEARRVNILPPPPVLQGRLVSVEGESTLVVNVGRDQTKRVLVTAETEIRRNGREVGVSALAEGDMLIVWGRPNDAGVVVAAKISATAGRPARPEPPREIRIRGTVEAKTDTELTVSTGGDTPITVKTNSETKFVVDGVLNASMDDVEVGDKVTVSGKRDVSAANTIEAKIVVVMP